MSSPLSNISFEEPNFLSLNNSLSHHSPDFVNKIHSFTNISLAEENNSPISPKKFSFNKSSDLLENNSLKNLFNINKRRLGRTIERISEIANFQNIHEKKSISDFEKQRKEGEEGERSSSESGNDGNSDGGYSYSSSSSRFSVQEDELAKVKLFEIDEK
jgi:hypothetical protein